MRTPHDPETHSDFSGEGLEDAAGHDQYFEPVELGNPWRRRMSPDEALNKYRMWLTGDVRCSWQAGPPPPVKELRGKNVACRCGPHDKCHGDIILEFLCIPDPMNRETIME
jgi:hypothetical protein